MASPLVNQHQLLPPHTSSPPLLIHPPSPISSEEQDSMGASGGGLAMSCSSVGKQRRKQSRPVRITTPVEDDDGPSMFRPNESERREIENVPLNLSVITRTSPSHSPPSTTAAVKTENDGTKDMTHSSTVGLSPFFCSPFLFPFSSTSSPPPVSTSKSLTTGGNPPLRIFNVEAYCELCKREFCNKYFLKTHKANKHGVYTDVTTPPLAEKGSSGSFTTMFPIVTTNSSLLSLSPSTMKNDLIPTKTDCNVSPVRTVEDPEAFCHICKKKFCNRYFVKRHIAKMHNIYDSSTESLRDCSRRGSSGDTSPVLPGSGMLNGEISIEKVPGPNQNHKSIFPQNGDRKQDSPLALTSQPAKDEVSCDLCFKNLHNVHHLRVHMKKFHGIILPGYTQDNISTEMGPEMSSPSNNRQGDEDSNSNNSADGHQSNLECDVCGRPYQNNYLLQMHKAYSHGTDPARILADVQMTIKNEKLEEGQIVDDKKTGDDLQRLQSMLLELNSTKKLGGSSSPSEKSLCCSLCGKSVENRYFLHAHMLNEHGVLNNEESESIQEHPQPVEKHRDSVSSVKEEEAESPDNVNSETYCAPCKKDFYDKYFFQLHMQHYHTDMLEDLNEQKGSPALSNDKMGPGEEGSPPTSSSPSGYIRATPTANLMPNLDMTNDLISSPSSFSKSEQSPNNMSHCYCNICQKELCNKYFMKIHMQKMHGINLDSASQVGGVTCDICHKTLCSKYFLKVHKQNVHHIPDDTPSRRETNRGSSSSSTSGTNNNGSTENHQRSKNSEMCPLCGRWFKNSKHLQNHLIVDHGEPGAKQKAPDTAGLQQQQQQQQPWHHILQQPDLASLSASAAVCMLCGQSFRDRLSLNVHIYTSHRPVSDRVPAWPVSTTPLPEPVENLNIKDSASPPEKHSTTNGDEKPNDCTPMNVLNKMEAASPRMYKCSYCPFFTHNLVYSIAHERTHTGLAPNTSFQSPLGQYPYNRGGYDLQSAALVESLRRRFLNPFLSYHSSPLFSDEQQEDAKLSEMETDEVVEEDKKDNSEVKNDEKEVMEEEKEIKEKGNPDTTIPPESPANPPVIKKRKKKKRVKCNVRLFCCPKCPSRFPTRELCLTHLHKTHNARKKPHIDLALKRWKPVHICWKCGWRFKSSLSLRCHMEKHQRNQNSRKHASNQFVMQPFVLSEPSTTEVQGCQFGPSLVVLPVSHKVSKPVTVSFTLTPAPRDLLNNTDSAANNAT